MLETLRNWWIQFVRKNLFDVDPEDIENWPDFDKYHWRNRN